MPAPHGTASGPTLSLRLDDSRPGDATASPGMAGAHPSDTMAPKYPKVIITADGRRHAVAKVWYQMGRGVYRVSWTEKGQARGCLAVVSPEAWEWNEVRYENGAVIDMVTPGRYTLAPQSLADTDDDLQDGSLIPER